MVKVAVTIRSFDMVKLSEKPGIDVVFVNETGKRMEGEGMVNAVKGAEAVIAGTEKFTREVLEKLPDLKVISRVGVGTDSIDLDAAKEFGVAVRNTPEAPVGAVAEHAITLLLCVMKKVCEYDRNIRSGEFSPLKGARLLEGRTVGVIGYGRIGKKFSSIVKAFGADVIWHDPYMESGSTGLDKLLRDSDAISLHASPGKGGKPILGEEEFGKCKKGVIIINTARGKLIDEDALARALEGGAVSGAGLDVFREEPYNGKLKDFPNMVMTPHVSSNVKETRERMEREAVKNLEG